VSIYRAAGVGVREGGGLEGDSAVADR